MGRTGSSPLTWLLLSLVLVAAATSAAIAADVRGFSPHAENLFSKGLKSYRQGRLERSRSQFRELLELAPNQRTTASLLMLGKVLFRSEEYEAGLTRLKQLQRRYPHSRYTADGLLMSGDTYYSMRRYYEASTQYGRLLATVASLIVQASAAERLAGIVKNRLITAQALDNIRLRVGPGRLSEALLFGEARWYQRLGWQADGEAALKAYSARYPEGIFTSVSPVLATADGRDPATEEFRSLSDGSDLSAPSKAAYSINADPIEGSRSTTGSVSGAAKPSQNEGKPELGLLLPLSGPGRAIGEELLRGVQLANEQVGDLFSLVVEDTGLDYLELPVEEGGGSQQLRSYLAAIRLVEREHIQALIGPVFSGGTVAAAALAESRGIPLVAPLAQQSDLDAVGGHVFQLNSTPKTQGAALAEQAVLTLGLHNVALLLPLSDYGWSFERSFTETVQSFGGNVVYADWYVPGETKDFKRAFEGIRRAGFSLMMLALRGSEEWWMDAEGELSADPGAAKAGDLQADESLWEGELIEAAEELIYSEELFIDGIDGVVLVVEDFDDAVLIAPQLHFHRLQTQVLGNDIWHEPIAIRQLRASDRRYLEGTVFISGFDHAAPAAKRFISQYRRRFGSDPGYAAYGYDAARLIAAGWSEGRRSRAGIKMWMGDLRGYEGASGQISFSDDSRSNSEFVLMRVETGGKLKTLGRSGP